MKIEMLKLREDKKYNKEVKQFHREGEMLSAKKKHQVGVESWNLCKSQLEKQVQLSKKSASCHDDFLASSSTTCLSLCCFNLFFISGEIPVCL